ncbi:hypothetical protein KI387_024145, partial [Taxus chinensis]
TGIRFEDDWEDHISLVDRIRLNKMKKRVMKEVDVVTTLQNIARNVEEYKPKEGLVEGNTVFYFL